MGDSIWVEASQNKYPSTEAWTPYDKHILLDFFLTNPPLLQGKNLEGNSM